MKKVVFVCLSHTLTAEQIADLNADQVVLVSPELGAKTKAIPANASLQEIQQLAADVVFEAISKGCTHFVCQGEPTFAMWANLIAGGYVQNSPVCGFFIDSFMNNNTPLFESTMTCIISTTERVSVDTPQADGSIQKISVFKHVQWRNLF